MLGGMLYDIGCVVLDNRLLARSSLIETGRAGIRLMIPGISFMSVKMALILFLA
jgi:hypothetical protein